VSIIRPLQIDSALLDPRLLGAALGDLASWSTWLAALRAAFGLHLNRAERRAFASIAGSRKPPAERVRELWCVVSRRAGKSRMAAALAVYFAIFVKHKVAPGEIPMVLLIAGSREQAGAMFGYVKGFLESSATLRNEVASITAHEITFKNGVVCGIHANSFRTIRSRTLVAAILDEVSFWFDEGARSDAEAYTAILPSLSTTNGMLIGIGSPYRKNWDYCSKNIATISASTAMTLSSLPVIAKRLIPAWTTV
jgi:phage terminase large subunit-like protein